MTSGERGNPRTELRPLERDKAFRSAYEALRTVTVGREQLTELNIADIAAGWNKLPEKIQLLTLACHPELAEKRREEIKARLLSELGSLGDEVWGSDE